MDRFYNGTTLFTVVALFALRVSARSKKAGGKASSTATKPLITDVVAFSSGPLPNINGINHGFLVKGMNTSVEDLKRVVNSAITSGVFSSSIVKVIPP